MVKMQNMKFLGGFLDIFFTRQKNRGLFCSSKNNLLNKWRHYWICLYNLGQFQTSVIQQHFIFHVTATTSRIPEFYLTKLNSLKGFMRMNKNGIVRDIRFCGKRHMSLHMFFKWAIEIAIVFNHYILTNSPDFSSTIPRTRPQKGMGFMQPHLKLGTFGAFPGRGLNVPILAT